MLHIALRSVANTPRMPPSVSPPPGVDYRRMTRRSHLLARGLALLLAVLGALAALQAWRAMPLGTGE